MSFAHVNQAHDCAEVDQHVAFNNYAEGSVRNLELLRDIERTCFALRKVTAFLSELNGDFNEMTRALASVKVPLPEDKVLGPIDNILSVLEEMHVRQKGGLASARADRQLRADDGVEDAYREALSKLLLLHETIADYKCAVMLHNAMLDTSGGVALSSEDQIREYLRSL